MKQQAGIDAGASHFRSPVILVYVPELFTRSATGSRL